MVADFKGHVLPFTKSTELVFYVNLIDLSHSTRADRKDIFKASSLLLTATLKRQALRHVVGVLLLDSRHYRTELFVSDFLFCFYTVCVCVCVSVCNVCVCVCVCLRM